MNTRNKIKATPKFYLFMPGAGFLSADQGLAGVKFTAAIEQAREFAKGFDNPADKLLSWNATYKISTGNEINKFQVFNTAK